MIICPKCGMENGKRVDDPVKCCRCWFQFVRGADRPHEKPAESVEEQPGNVTK